MNRARGSPRSRSARPCALGLAVLAASAALGSLNPEAVRAHPVPSLHPGGPDARPDTLVLEYPVRRAPSLLALQAVAPLAALAARAPSDPPPTLLRRDEAGAAGAVAAGAEGPSGEVGGTAGRDALLVSGSKSFAVELGRGRDASLKQALDLTIRGRVAGDLEVAATVSDQRLPFEPDGTTRELADLDRVAISLRAPQGDATLGDFRLDGMPGTFARVSRALQGVRGAARVHGVQWDVAAASPKGERRTLELRGEEGKQGPYALLGHGAESDAGGVVAGSETVWLDGAKQRRGSDLDYVIDYGAGTITFTVRHPISAESRIAADFESATGRYRRTFYAASTRREWKPGEGWYASFVREGDDTESPLGASLSADDRRALGALGDSVAGALPSGVRDVGAGNGSYVWDESDPARAHWVWLGPTRGNFEVAFTEVGAGRGAYADTLAVDGTRFYRYMGAALGSFEPGRALAVPRENVVMDLGGAARLFGTLGVEGEIARSGYDRNALSSIDDGDNAGTAARFAARLEPRPLRLFGTRLGSIGATASFRSRDERFTALDRLDASFEGERWNQAAAAAGDRREELSLSYDPAASIGVRADLGLRTLTGGSRSVRRAAALEIRSFLPGSVRWEEARNTSGASRGARSRWGLDLAREKGIVLPRFSAGEERIEGQEGDSADARRSRLWTAGLGVSPNEAVRLRASFGWRRDETRLGGASAAREARTWEGGAVARAGGAFTADASFSRRRVLGSSGPEAADLAQLLLAGGRAGGPITSELRYDVTQLREPSIQRALVAVGSGSGSYDEYGNARLGGGYELVSSTGAPSTRSRANVQLRVDAYPGRAARGGARGILKALGSSSYFRLETLSTLPLGRIERAFRVGDYLASGSTLRGSWTARQTLDYAPWGARYDARLELGARGEVNGELTGLESRGSGRDARLRVRQALPLRLRATASADLARATQETAHEEGAGAYASIVRGRGYELELGRPAGSGWTLSLLGRHRRDVDMTRGGYQDAWSVGPAARAAGARLRLDGRGSYGRLDQRGAYAPAGRYLIAPLGPRVDLDLLGEYQVRDRISLSLAWNGSRVEGRRSTFNGRLELRSTF